MCVIVCVSVCLCVSTCVCVHTQRGRGAGGMYKPGSVRFVKAKAPVSPSCVARARTHTHTHNTHKYATCVVGARFWGADH